LGSLSLKEIKLERNIVEKILVGDIPHEKLGYGQLIAYIQNVALKIIQDDKF